MPNIVVIPNPAALRQYLETEVGASDYVTVDQQRIAQFADVTQDWQWIHTDVERAATESPFKATVAHGFLTLSLLSCFMNGIVDVRGARAIVISGVSSVRFISPVLAGSRLRGRAWLRDFVEAPDFVQATWRVTIECEHNRVPACVVQLDVRYYC